MKTSTRVAFAAVLAASAIVVSNSAFANKMKCERHAFTVNDFGKEGPIKMARANLYKYVEKLKQEKGLKKVTVKESPPSCELYIDLIVFDEHTCKIEANICY